MCAVPDVQTAVGVRILYRKHVGLACHHRWGRSPLGLGRRNPSRWLLPPPSRHDPLGLGLGEAQPLVLLPPLAAAPPGHRP
jgi:hypothetical protein